MTTDGETTDYTYDSANRLLTAGDASYTYDEAGQLTSKTDGAGTTQYEYSPEGKLSRVAYEDGTDVRYGYDGLGSVTDLTDRSGDAAMQYRYDAFGGMFTGITSPYNTVGFTGKSYDPKAELVEFYARWYDPSVGVRSRGRPGWGLLRGVV